MKTVCTFCNSIMHDEQEPDNRVNHGVCELCYTAIMRDYGFNVRKFLNLLDAPVFLVDSEATVIAANTLAMESTKKPVSLVNGKLCGDVLGCINAFLPEGCGKTPHCPDCIVRLSINETYTTGMPVIHRTVAITRNKEGNQVTEQFLVSTQKDGNTVLLRLEPGNKD